MCYVSIAEVYRRFGKFFAHHEPALMMEVTESFKAGL
jgi:hypothetical protein